MIYKEYLDKATTPYQEGMIDNLVNKFSKIVAQELHKFMQGDNFESNVKDMGIKDEIEELEKLMERSPQVRKFIESRIKHGK